MSTSLLSPLVRVTRLDLAMLPKKQIPPSLCPLLITRQNIPLLLAATAQNRPLLLVLAVALKIALAFLGANVFLGIEEAESLEESLFDDASLFDAFLESLVRFAPAFVPESPLEPPSLEPLERPFDDASFFAEVLVEETFPPEASLFLPPRAVVFRSLEEVVGVRAGPIALARVGVVEGPLALPGLLQQGPLNPMVLEWPLVQLRVHMTIRPLALVQLPSAIPVVLPANEPTWPLLIKIVLMLEPLLSSLIPSALLLREVASLGGAALPFLVVQVARGRMAVFTVSTSVRNKESPPTSTFTSSPSW